MISFLSTSLQLHHSLLLTRIYSHSPITVPVPSRYICLHIAVDIVDSCVPNSNQPYTICTRGDVIFGGDGPVTIAVRKLTLYCISAAV